MPLDNKQEEEYMFVYDKKTEKKYEVFKIKKENSCTRFFIRKRGQWLWEDADCFVTWEETEAYKLSFH